MQRRDFLSVLGSAAAWPLVAQAQRQAIPVFGILLVFSREFGRIFTEPLRAYMQALGYFEGRNIAFDVRYADGKIDRLPALAAELVAQRPAVIATFGDAAGLAAKAATTTTPIVSMSEDLVRAKLVTSMRQPEGNLTGVSIMGTELDAKRLEILAEFSRRAARCFYLQTRAHTVSPDQLSMQPRRRSGSPFAKLLLARQSKSSRPCARPRTAVRLALMCCPLRCCSRYEGASLASLRNFNSPRCINGRKRRTKAV